MAQQFNSGMSRGAQRTMADAASVLAPGFAPPNGNVFDNASSVKSQLGLVATVPFQKFVFADRVFDLPRNLHQQPVPLFTCHGKRDSRKDPVILTPDQLQQYFKIQQPYIKHAVDQFRAAHPGMQTSMEEILKVNEKMHAQHHGYLGDRDAYLKRDPNPLCTYADAKVVNMITWSPHQFFREWSILGVLQGAAAGAKPEEGTVIIDGVTRLVNYWFNKSTVPMTATLGFIVKWDKGEDGETRMVLSAWTGENCAKYPRPCELACEDPFGAMAMGIFIPCAEYLYSNGAVASTQQNYYTDYSLPTKANFLLSADTAKAKRAVTTSGANLQAVFKKRIL